jgi:hypothetical protein
MLTHSPGKATLQGNVVPLNGQLVGGQGFAAQSRRPRRCTTTGFIKSAETKSTSASGSRRDPLSLQEAIAGLNRGVYEASVDLFTNRTLGTLTNVPGPPTPVYLAGSKVEGIFGWAPVSGNQPYELHTIHSYNGQVIVGIACDTTLVPDH